MPGGHGHGPKGGHGHHRHHHERSRDYAWEVEMADFFLRIEATRWCLCHGSVERRLHLSLRTVLRQGTAGAVMAAVLDGLGEGGGHDMMAGGQAPLPEDPEAAEALVREVELRFLRRIDVSVRTPEPLIPQAPPSAGGAAS